MSHEQRFQNLWQYDITVQLENWYQHTAGLCSLKCCHKMYSCLTSCIHSFVGAVTGGGASSFNTIIFTVFLLPVAVIFFGFY